jgi:hypothetical protein
MGVELHWSLQITQTKAVGENLTARHAHGNHPQRLIVQSSDPWDPYVAYSDMSLVITFCFFFLALFDISHGFLSISIWRRMSASPSSRDASCTKPHAFDATVF